MQFETTDTETNVFRYQNGDVKLILNYTDHFEMRCVPCNNAFLIKVSEDKQIMLQCSKCLSNHEYYFKNVREDEQISKSQTNVDLGMTFKKSSVGIAISNNNIYLIHSKCKQPLEIMLNEEIVLDCEISKRFILVKCSHCDDCKTYKVFRKIISNLKT